MFGDDADLLNGTGFAQPALFAVEVALFRLVESWGVKPDFVLGHSVGEIAAAHVAGVFSLEDACTLVSARARLMDALPEGGAMVAIEATEDEVLPLLVEGVSIAAVNGPESVVVSGVESVALGIAAGFEGRGRKTRRLLVSHAFHSPLMDAMVDEFRVVVEGLAFHEPHDPVIASGDVTSAEFWVQQVREPVRFADAVRTSVERGVTAFLELGPDGVLSGMAAGSLSEDVLVVPALRRDRDEEAALVTALARLYVSGVPVVWSVLFEGTGARRVELPTYAFQHERYWVEPAQSVVDPVDAEFWGLVDAGALASALELDEGTASVVTPALSSWRDRHRAQSTVDSWRYREFWKLLPDDGNAVLPGTWLVVVPPVFEADWLTLPGLEVVRIEGADRAGLAKSLGTVSLGDARGVVSLLDLHGSLALVQALGDVGVTAPLWCLTRGAVSIGAADAVSSPESSALWGLGRVAALELSHRWGGLVDLPEVVDQSVLSRLAAVLTNSTGEDQIAIRPEGVYGRRLVRATASVGQGSWRARGTVLITGGTGGLGGCVARWVVARGAEHVVLASRRGLAAPGAVELRDELVSSGARVTVVACDVADRDALVDVLAGIPADCPLTAVLHAAGVGDGDAPVESLTPEQLAGLMRPKMDAGRHLHELTSGLDLDAFVLFSSGAASWGSGGQPGYSAANAFLDGLAQYRRGQGLVATSIAWGAWAETGMAAADPLMSERLARQGVLSMNPDLAVTALQQALADDETTVMVTNIDWARFAPSFTAGRPSSLLSDIPEAHQALADASQSAQSDGAEFLQRFAGLREAEVERLLSDLVRAEAAAVLGHASAGVIGADKAFREQGFDSLTAVEMRDRLRVATGLALPAALVFDHPTPRAVAHYLRSRLAVHEPSAPGSVLDELSRFESALWSTSADSADHDAIRERLEQLLSRLPHSASTSSARSSEEDIKTLPVDELLSMIDEELFDIS
ncbi:MAG: SDR family NAD(P)-dependent oxidoreductase [Umezawaea sp.]